MTLLLLSSLLLGLVAPGGEQARLEIRVTASDAGGIEDSGLAHRLVQALGDAGLPAKRLHEAAGGCGDACVRVVVRKMEPHRFVVEVRSRSGVTQTPVQLEPTATPFDQAHALAIQIEVLAERAPVRRWRPTHRSIAAAADASPEGARPVSGTTPTPESPRPSVEPPTASAPPQPAPPAQAAVRVESPPANAVTIQKVPLSPAPQDDELLALNVAATTLIGASGDLFMYGFHLGVRVRLNRRVDLRTGVSLLRAQNRIEQGMSFHRELLPFQLGAAIEFPGLRGLRAGAGIEAIFIGGDDEQGRGGPSAWSAGGIGGIEYRRALRSLALIASVQGAFHPPSLTVGDSGPLLVIPRWTLSVSLGLEFRVL